MSDQDNEQPQDLEGDEPQTIMQKLRRASGTGVGVEDPNIVGDVGPTDVPPGRDPDSDVLDGPGE